IRVEQLRPAGPAVVRAIVVAVPILAGEGALGPLLPHHLELEWRQLRAPFLVGLVDLALLLFPAPQDPHDSLSHSAPIQSRTMPSCYDEVDPAAPGDDGPPSRHR